jgi:His-Xaa-Ser system protein HxsD
MNRDAHGVTVQIDAAVFSLEAVQAASYRVSDRFYVELMSTPGGYRAVLRPRSSASVDIEGEFRNELIEAALRDRIARETLAMRNLILAQAFSSMTLMEPRADTADYRNDPLGISAADPSGGRAHEGATVAAPTAP